ncbi:ArsR/SmtB family transcription factor [Kribbella deserti]|uniref:ArsR/SmtB family transcription factor n=1 Tax=Kribbella deserti TaxID=1926257 RepID=A0ABV6QET8_9ACTN
MIRIHFAAGDLGRVSLATAPDPLWEVALSACVLRGCPAPLAARRWSHEARARLHPAMQPLFKLISANGSFPDFLTPDGGDLSADAAIEQVIDAPHDQLRADLEPWITGDAEPWLTDLLAGRRVAREALGQAVRSFHRDVITPSGAWLRRRAAADTAARVRTLTSQGLDGLLADLHPDARWLPEAGVLSVLGPMVSDPVDVHLEGRGLRLYPSALTAEFLIFDPPGRKPMLIYPAAPFEADLTAPADDNLEDLLGRSRAAVLRSLVVTASTTQLAARTGLSMASASEHARVLRAAGLLATHRTGGLALHSVTDAGADLLRTSELQRQQPAVRSMLRGRAGVMR